MKFLNCIMIAFNVALCCYMIAYGNELAAAISGGAAAVSAILTWGIGK